MSGITTNYCHFNWKTGDVYLSPVPSFEMDTDWLSREEPNLTNVTVQLRTRNRRWVIGIERWINSTIDNYQWIIPLTEEQWTQVWFEEMDRNLNDGREKTPAWLTYKPTK